MRPTIIFDLGGVLIDWNPLYVFDDNYFESEEKRKYFFDHVCTSDWNEEQDAGRLLELATAERLALFPEWEKPIRDFYGRWEEMLKGDIPETVEVLRRLRDSGQYRLLALTNWSAETFPIALRRFEFLHWFEGILVSGEEKTRKPFPEIYELLLCRYQVDPATAVFIDDNLRNVKAAEACGISGIHFTSAQELEAKIKIWVT